MSSSLISKATKKLFNNKRLNQAIFKIVFFLDFTNDTRLIKIDKIKNKILLTKKYHKHKLQEYPTHFWREATYT